MILVAIAAVWILSLSLMAGLCASARRGDMEASVTRAYWSAAARNEEIDLGEFADAGHGAARPRRARVEQRDGIAA